jgi:tRNA-2-methylthio-N6-dimethylallyladenosine synthase
VRALLFVRAIVPKKIYIKSFGCQMNEYDSSKMADVLIAQENMVITDRPEDADVILLNTCSIRENAQEKVFHQLGRWKPLKNGNPDLIIGVGGCVASQEGASILTRAPYVDVVFGPQTLHRLPQLIRARKLSGIAQVDISFPEIEKFDYLSEPRVEGPSAYLSIMEGCDKYCSYCIVPFTRGTEVSRPFDDVIAEAAQLVAHGVNVITLLGQNVNAYRGVMHGGEFADLSLLLHYLAEMSGIERLSFTTSHPVEFSQPLIDAYSSIPKLMSTLHLPVQSGSDRVLAAMKRGYTILEYKSKIRKLRAIRPDVAISSDFIVGFPGETEEDFEATMKLVDDIGFDASYSFIYSARPGTPAADLLDNTPLAVKQERLKRLQDKLDQQAQGLSQGMIGSRQRILVEGSAKKGGGDLSGRTGNNRVVNFLGDASLIGRFVDVTITAAYAYSLRGEFLDGTGTS